MTGEQPLNSTHEVNLIKKTFLFLNVNFPHRLNPNGTYDSICAGCFITVATANKEDDLLAGQNAHICLGPDPNHVYYRLT